MTAIAEREREKYGKVWALSDYRKTSPGEDWWLEMFLDMVGEERGTLLDAGCGTGRAGDRLAELGFDVTLMDLQKDAVESPLPFVEGCLWHELTGTYQYGFSCDVMEHIPTEFTMLTVVRMLEVCRHVFLAIHTEPDQFGVRVGEPLHLTVQPFTWWRDRLREVAIVEDARDCLNAGVFYLTT